MLCAYCGDRLRWPADFPKRHLASCDRCTREHAAMTDGAVQFAIFLAVLVATFAGLVHLIGRT